MIGIIGAGGIGQALARRLASAGLDAVISNSHGPEFPGRRGVQSRAEDFRRYRGRSGSSRCRLHCRAVEPSFRRIIWSTGLGWPDRDRSDEPAEIRRNLKWRTSADGRRVKPWLTWFPEPDG